MGWRARIGIIFPNDGDSDDDYLKMIPPGVTVHISRNEAPWTDDVIQSVKAQLEEGFIEAAAKLLTPIRPDSVGYGCSSGSFVGGAGYDQKIISVIEKVTGSPATTGSTASIGALKALGIGRVAIATPYEEARNEILAEFMEGNGFEVVNLKGLRLPEDIRSYLPSLGLTLSSMLDPRMAYRLGKEADAPRAEGVLIACTSFRTAEMIEPLEQDLGKPVVTANQAVMWDALRLAGVCPRMEGLGKLYDLEP